MRADADDHQSRKKSSATRADIPVRSFRDAVAWEAWVAKNQTAVDGIWMRIAKKASGTPSVTYPEALEIALCYGWIDAQKRGESEATWLQRFMPRAKKSIWSRINRDKALALIASGRMKPGGLGEVERAKQDGRWEAAYDSASTATVPPDFKRELEKSPQGLRVAALPVSAPYLLI